MRSSSVRISTVSRVAAPTVRDGGGLLVRGDAPSRRRRLRGTWVHVLLPAAAFVLLTGQLGIPATAEANTRS